MSGAARPPARAAPAKAADRRSPGKAAASPGRASAAQAPRRATAPPCACGGGCPRCRKGAPAPRAPKPPDAAEREARALAPHLAAAARRPAADAPREAGAAAASRPAAPILRDGTSPGRQGARSASTAASGPPRGQAPAPQAGSVRANPARGPPLARAALRPSARPDRRLGAGRALSRTERAGFEAALETDLAPVRLHDGPAAAALADGRDALAFTYGTHVVLGRAAQALPAGRLTPVLAHELVHVVQQAAPPIRAPPRRRHPGRARAPPPVRPALRMAPECRDVELPPWARNAADRLGHSAASTFEGAVDLGSEALESGMELAGEAAGAVAEVGEQALESAETVIETLAPGLLEFLRGGVLDDLADLFCQGIGTLLDRLTSPLMRIDPMSGLETLFRTITHGVQAAYGALGSVASAALGTLIGPIVRVIDVFGDDILSAIRSLSDGVSGVFTAIWDNVAVPVLDFLGSVGGAVWDAFGGLVTWIWDLTRPVRAAAEYVWDWLTAQFGLAWDSTAGVRAWLAEKAGAAWDAFMELIEPVRTPLMIVAGVLLMVTPLGPILILSQVLPPVWAKLRWLAANWRDTEIVVRARTVLQEDILPFLIGAVEGAKLAISSGAAWLAGMIAAVAQGMASVVTAFSGSDCLSGIGAVLVHVGDQFRRLQAWAAGGFAGLSGAIDAALEALAAIFRPILDFLVRLALVVANPPLLPVAITAAIWLLVPEEFKPSIVRFVLGLLIAFLAAMPGFLPGLGPLAGVLKAAALGFLRHLRDTAGVATSVAAADRIARLAAGGGLQFIAGFAAGLLRGLIDGIIDPFRLLFMLFELVVTGLRVLGQVLRPYLERMAPEAAVQGMEALRAATAVPQPDAGAGPASGPPEAAETGGAGMARGPPAASEAGSTATLRRGSARPERTTGAGRAAPEGMATAAEAGSAPAAAPARGDAGEAAPAGTPRRAGADPAPAPAAAPAPAGGAGEPQAASAAGAGGGTEDALPDATGLPPDREIAARLSPNVIAAVASAPPGEVGADALETEMRDEVGARGSSVGGLAALLGGAWTAIMEGAAGLGGRIAGWLIEFLGQSDYEIGNQIGWLAGMVLLELLIAYFTAGGYTVIREGASIGRRLLAYLLRFLDMGGEILGFLGRALAPLRGPILRGLGAARGFLSRFRFIGGLLDRIAGYARRLFGFADEAAAATTRAAPGPRAVVPEPPARVPDLPARAPDLPPTRAPDVPTGRAAEPVPGRTPEAPPAAVARETQEAGERAAREAMDAPPTRPASEAAEETADGALRAVDEPGVPRVADDAAKAAQLPEAVAAARLLVATNDVIDTPVPAVLGQLIVLKRRYRWIDTFRADRRGPGLYRFTLVASEHDAGPYDIDSEAEASGRTQASEQRSIDEVQIDDNVTWNPENHPNLGPDGLPPYDGSNTLGRLDCDAGTRHVKNGRGQPGQGLFDDPAVRAGAVSPTHAEGHASAIMRQTGSREGTLRINNPDGPCGFCDKVIENMLPEGARLRVVWPGGERTFVGNAK